MSLNIGQLQRQARLRYFPLKPHVEQGISQVLSHSSQFFSHGDTFGDAIEHLLTLDQQLGEAMFGETFFRMIERCEGFPLRIESYGNKEGRRARALVLKSLEYRVMGESLHTQHLNFAHKRIPPIITSNRLVRFMPLQLGEQRDLWTSDTAIAIVPVGSPLNVAHSDGHDILPSGNAAIVMAGARLMVKGRGFFAFHPLGMPVR